MSQNFETFGKYILLEKIAMGGMAEIYLARNSGASGVSKFFAIKRILPHFTEQTEFIDMFKDEANIAVQLSHANIGAIYEFDVEKGMFYLAMDYIEGRNLRQILNKMKKSGLTFTIEQVLYIVKEVASGLDAAHRCIDSKTGKPLNIIHRDMSPQNVMISFEGEVKIVDFGIAKAETQLETTRAGTLKGKFGYMSPEQAEGQPVDLRTDVFAIGIVLWELLANDRLFIANNEVNTLRKIRDCQIPSLRKINPNIPPELERIVSKSLAKDRNLRYQTAAALHRDLSRFLNRQYPDFSPQDFSVYIKNLFAGEILESRKKMIEYSKLDASKLQPAAAPPSTAPEGTVVTATQTEMESESSSDVDFGKDDSKAKATNGKPITIQIGKPPETPPAPKNAANTAATAAATAGGPKPPPQTASRKSEADLTFEPRSQMMIREGTFSGNTRSFTQSKKIQAPKTMSGSFIASLMLLGIAIGGAAYYVSNPDRATKQSRDALVQLGIMPPLPVETTTHASEQPTPVPVIFDSISFTSAPSGAPIEIDGVLTGDSTPATIKLQRGKLVHVAIRLAGYTPNPFETSFTVQGPIVVDAQFKSDKKGFLNIFVKGAGQIYIDDKMLDARSPALMVPIAADQNVTVIAYDPQTNTGDRMVVNLPAGTTRTINLIPRALPPRQATPSAPMAPKAKPKPNDIF